MNVYFADKLNVSAQSVNADFLSEILGGRNIEPEILNEIRKLFDELAHGRFSSVQKGKDDMKDVYQRVDRLITRFEKVKLK